MALHLFKRLDSRLMAEIKTQRKTVVKGLLCVLTTSALTACTIPLIKLAGQSLREGDMHLMGWVCTAIITIYAIKYWFTRGQTYFLSLASNRLSTNLRRRLFSKLQKLPITYFNQKRAGAIQSVLTNDVSVYQSAITLVRDSIDGPFKAVAALVAIFVLQWKLALMALLFLPLMAILIQRNGRKMKIAQGQVQKDLSDLNANTNEMIQGTRIVKAFAAEDRVEETYGNLVEQSFNSQMAAVNRMASLRPLVELIGAVSLAAVFYVGGILAAAQELKVDDLLALIYALDVINQGMRNLGSVNNTYNQVQAAAERIYAEILDVPEEHRDERGTKTIPLPEGRIEFKNVSFSYPDGTEALRDVSFVLEPGTSLALVGTSGAGKSTIADLVMRFYDPSSGTITFDGVDIRELKTQWLRSQIGVVPQQTFLFAGTIADNIRLGAPDATEFEIAEASRAAHADVFIDEIPNRYETVLGERGVRLSGGQMQRVAIARAVVRKPALLLLDEATSALDAESEKAVQLALDEIMKERTTLFIAHRLTTAARADRILMLSRGEIVEYGAHKELMEGNGPYAAMYRTFSSGLFDEPFDSAPPAVVEEEPSAID